MQEPPLIADLIVEGAAVKSGLLGPGFWEDETKRRMWKDVIAEWMDEALKLPGSKADVENYGKSIAILIHVKAKLYWRLARAVYKQQIKDHAGVRTFVDKEFGEVVT